MWGEGERGSAIVLAVPVRCDEPTVATEKWLLALWQASKKRTWSFWRSQATVSLEYLVSSGRLRYQVHLASPLLADVTLPLLSAHFGGIEASPTDVDVAVPAFST